MRCLEFLLFLAFNFSIISVQTFCLLSGDIRVSGYASIREENTLSNLLFSFSVFQDIFIYLNIHFLTHFNFCALQCVTHYSKLCLKAADTYFKCVK